MRYSISLSAIVSVFLILTACDNGVNPAIETTGSEAEVGTFEVFVSNNKANERVRMEVTSETTFGDVRAFALGAMNLSGQAFELQIAGKTPELTDLLSDHGIAAPAQPANMPVGNILVRIKD